MLRKIFLITVLIFLYSSFAYSEDKVEIVTSFEDEADVDLWGADDGCEIVSEHATDGLKSLKVEYKASEAQERRAYLEGKKFESIMSSDWSAFKLLKADVYNAGDKGADLQVRIKSDEHQKVWSKVFKIPSKKNYTIDIPMKDLSAKISLDNIMYLGFAMGKNQYLLDMKPLDSDFILYFDNIRFTK